MGIIRIDNLEIFANHGVLGEEKVLGQKFIVCVEMELDINSAAREDNINKSVNYTEVCRYVEEYSKSNCFNLIESLADGLAIGIMKNFPVAAAEVEVKKPNAPIHMHFGYVSVKTKRKWSDAYISVGSNMGDRQRYIDNAIEMIDENEMMDIKNISSVIETRPYGNTNQNDFLNGCIHIRTLYSPYELLENLQKIEADNDRVRKEHWGPRTLDLDILMFEDNVITTDNLILPHPDMTNRSFVLEPLCEIAPYVVHPITKKTVLELFKLL